MTVSANIREFKTHIPSHVQLIAVSKTKPTEAILEAYQAGQRLFGENKVQELVAKQPVLPSDIEWHLIGHLQSNKVKYIAPFIAMIQSVDSLRLLESIEKEASKHNRSIKCLLQVHIASEATKFGMDETELHHCIDAIKAGQFPNIRICGLMGMATNTTDMGLVHKEFSHLHALFQSIQSTWTTNPEFTELSMGMSSDYTEAIACGSTMIRVGSLLFGER